MSDDYCKTRYVKVGTSDHCLHECTSEGKTALVCCWCGDLYQSELEGMEHGEFAPPLRSHLDVACNCDTCPFSFRTHIWRCTHPIQGPDGRKLGLSDVEIEHQSQPPDWCPLRTGPTLIKLVSREDWKRGCEENDARRAKETTDDV